MANKKISTIKKKAWVMFSIYIRKFYSDENGITSCYTCGKVGHWSSFQAGHFVGGRNNAVLLNEECVRVQCVHCNIFLRGNYQAYTLKMLDEVGREKVDELLSLKNVIKKMSYQDFEEAFENYKLLAEADIYGC